MTQESNEMDLHAVLQLQTDKYLTWLLRQKESKFGNWKEPTVKEIDSFSYWRKSGYDRMSAMVALREGSALPEMDLYEHKMHDVAYFLSDPERLQVIQDMIQSALTDKYYTLAETLGMIDFARTIEKPGAEISNSGTITVDPLNYIDPVFLPLFLEVEKKATEGTFRFETAIRCAAFCELLYERKWLINTKKRRLTIIDFAKSKYGIDIRVAMATTKDNAREDQKLRFVKNHPPLRSFF